MNITKTSMISGITRTIDLPVTQKQIDEYNTGNYKIQDIFSNLSPSQREFILSGITDEEWDDVFGEGCSTENDSNDEDPFQEWFDKEPAF